MVGEWGAQEIYAARAFHRTPCQAPLPIALEYMYLPCRQPDIAHLIGVNQIDG